MNYYVNCNLPKFDVELAICLLVCSPMSMILLTCTYGSTVLAVCYLLKLCDDYTNAFSIMFNATKCKYIIFKSTRMCTYTEPNFYIGGIRIEIVNGWPLLGHMIHCQCNDRAAVTCEL